MELNEKLKAIRNAKGFTQKMVADYLDVDRSTYAYYETGTSTPSIGTLQKLSTLYDISIDYIVNDPFIGDLTVANVVSVPEKTARLTSDEIGLLEMYRKLSDEKKKALFALLKSFGE